MSGYTIWRGPSLLDGAPLVVILTKPHSAATAQRKLGQMWQTWIIREDVAPAEAVREGKDASVCGDCDLRGSEELTRMCYVHLGHLGNIWKAYHRGAYPELTKFGVRQAVEGRAVRIGAYGDPRAVPDKVWASVRAWAKYWTAYTHQWRNERGMAPSFMMASVDSPSERRHAKALGYRTFRTRRPDEPLLEGEIACPASEEMGHRSTCEECGLCDGLRGGADRKDIAIMLHGPAARSHRRLPVVTARV